MFVFVQNASKSIASSGVEPGNLGWSVIGVGSGCSLASAGSLGTAAGCRSS
jgi:hypothetical protein